MCSLEEVFLFSTEILVWLNFWGVALLRLLQGVATGRGGLQKPLATRGRKFLAFCLIRYSARQGIPKILVSVSIYFFQVGVTITIT